MGTKIAPRDEKVWGWENSSSASGSGWALGSEVRVRALVDVQCKVCLYS